MATPRKRWFKCADSILREPWPREHKLALILLMAHLNTRWARDAIPDEDAGNCVLSSGALSDITGAKRIRSGFSLLSKLALSVSFTVSIKDEFVTIEWPKYAEFQHSVSPIEADSGDCHGLKNATSDSDSNSDSGLREKEKSHAVREPVASAPAGRPDLALENPGPPKPRKAREPRASKATDPIGMQAVAAWVEAQKARGAKWSPLKGESTTLLEIAKLHDDIDEFKRSVAVYFARDSPWPKANGFPVAGFKTSWSECRRLAGFQESARRSRRPEDDIDPCVTDPEGYAHVYKLLGGGRPD